MASMSDKYAGKGLVVVAINLDKNREAADAFLEKYVAPFTVAFDASGKTAEQFHVEAMPSSFIIDRNGTIVLVHAGFEPATARAVEERVKEELSR
jgi:cytochrome c biogenesis protein CcmG/thiol:disulfide interchange protein DsbE